MRLVVLLLVIALVFFVYVLVCRRGVEHFFFGNNSIAMTWAAVPGAASYNWRVCIPSPNACNANPALWSGPIQSSTTNSAILNSTTCSGCDFGSTIQFAVQTVGTNGLSSSWTAIALNLQSHLQLNQQRLVTSATVTTPPKVGDTSSLYQISFLQPIPAGINEKNFAYVTVTRGGTVYHYNDPQPYVSIPNIFTAAQVIIDYTAANTNWNVPIPGGSLQGGDLIAVTSLFVNSGVSGPPWLAPNPNGPVYYYSSYQVTTLTPPAAPGALTWQVN